MARVLLGLMMMAAVAVAQESPHGPIKFECNVCHSTDSWQMRSDPSFDHSSVGFALTGGHKTLACRSCHENLQFTQRRSDCLSCHTDVHKSELGANCLRCHTTQSWVVADMVQKHQQTRFPLLGRHSTLDCQTCHSDAAKHQYAGIPTTCIGCHRDDFAGSKAPNHIAAGFSTDCTRCHTVTSISWGSGFDHNLTRFPLTGAHQAQPCASCHADNVFTDRSTECISCHQASYATAVNPNHVSANFPKQCETCHTTATWHSAKFDHSTTKFPLTGSHATQLCQACHRNGDYQLAYTSCAQCHLSDFQKTINPNHVTGNFSQTCQTCHTTTAWRPASFDHNTTKFALTGRHTAQPCAACHTNGNYQLVYTSCVQCHLSDFQKTINPNHVAGNFSQACQTCHTTTAWVPATFDHNTTKFTLTGRHTAQPCAACHTNGNYQLVYTSCAQCHLSDFQKTINPNHVTGNFSQTCQTCHTTTAWRPASFDHNTTKFALTGSHTAQPCAACHTNGNYQLVYTSCVQCHLSDFQKTINPNHVTGNFSQTCQTCHTTTAWKPSTFSHSSTIFALTGAHQALACVQCHVNNQYQNLPTDCNGCHATNFANTANPNHVTNNFSRNCIQCHTTTAWRPASFDHNVTKFALTGSHTSQACAACHTNGNYQLVYTGCVQCHQANYQQTTNPNHVALLFSQDCQTCHTTTAWRPSTFNHDQQYFRIYSGHHQGRWTSCSDCHKTPGNYADFTCTTCHTKTSVDSHHTSVRGYVYASPSCYSCHRGV